MTLRTTARKFLPSLIVVALIPFCIFLALAPYSLILGWNGLTLFLFWFIICPTLTLFLSAKLLKQRYRVWKGLVSLIIFYVFMVFMIYKHFETDFFAVMMISLCWNVLLIVIVMLGERDARRLHH